MFFAFIDESEYPKPNEKDLRPVLVAVCIKDQDIRHITQRLYKADIDCFGEDPLGTRRTDVLVIFDKIDDANDGAIAQGFKGFLFKHELGRDCRNIVEMPLFVSSINNPMICFPDLIGNVLREYFNHELDRKVASSSYEEWLKSLAQRVMVKSKDFRSNHSLRYGIYQMNKDRFVRKTES